MIKPLVAAVAGIGLMGAAAGVYVVASPGGGEEEAVSQLPSPTVPLESPLPSILPTIPADLPPPADGYTWYVSPPSNFGLQRYAVQVPLEWAALNPGDSNPQDFAPLGLQNILLGPSLTTVTTIAAEASAPAFRFELPSQGGQLCGILPSGHLASGTYVWDLFRFKCPMGEPSVCQADITSNLIGCRSADGSPATSTIDGRAAEVHTGAFFFSIIAFDPQSAPPPNGVLEQAVSSLALR